MAASPAVLFALSGINTNAVLGVSVETSNTGPASGSHVAAVAAALAESVAAVFG
jgi:hypothetical protein